MEVVLRRYTKVASNFSTLREESTGLCKYGIHLTLPFFEDHAEKVPDEPERQRPRVLPDHLLEPQKPVVADQEVLARPHTPRTPPKLTWIALSISSSATR